MVTLPVSALGMGGWVFGPFADLPFHGAAEQAAGVPGALRTSSVCGLALRRQGRQTSPRFLQTQDATLHCATWIKSTERQVSDHSNGHSS